MSWNQVPELQHEYFMNGVKEKEKMALLHFRTPPPPPLLLLMTHEKTRLKALP